MVSAAFNIERDARTVGSHVLVEASSPPGVELSVRENGVGVCEEVLLDVVATEETESPFVVWRQPELLLAHLCVGIVIE